MEKEKDQDKAEVIMKKRNNYLKLGYWIFVCAIYLTGCAKGQSTEEKIFVEGERKEEKTEPGKTEGEEKEEKTGEGKTEEGKTEERTGEGKAEEGKTEERTGEGKTEERAEEGKAEERTEEGKAEEKTGEGKTEEKTEAEKTGQPEPEIFYADWSGYFNGLNGTAVIYDGSDRRYTIYNDELAEARRPPCSTFKIISSLTALEHGILEPGDSTRTWSSEVFWNGDWNRDIDFSEAFRTSCVWYYRQLIDDIGKDRMQKELDKLRYGNCDISDWEGRLNTNNNNRALTGFWIESSLLISPKEQAEVMERIFGENSEYAEETQNELKQVMLVSDQERKDIAIYGKTGMGKADGVVVDAWFTGFAESEGGNLYFCVRLGRTDGMNVSSTLAKEIAVRLLEAYIPS